MGVVSAVRPDEFEPGKALADFVEYGGRTVAVVHAGRADDSAQRQALHVYQRMNFSTSPFADVVADQTVMTAPFPAGFND
jgi:hypothetical protein